MKTSCSGRALSSLGLSGQCLRSTVERPCRDVLARHGREMSEAREQAKPMNRKDPLAMWILDHGPPSAGSPSKRCTIPQWRAVRYSVRRIETRDRARITTPRLTTS